MFTYGLQKEKKYVSKLKNAIWRQWFCLEIFPYDLWSIYKRGRIIGFFWSVTPWSLQQKLPKSSVFSKRKQLFILLLYFQLFYSIYLFLFLQLSSPFVTWKTHLKEYFDFRFSTPNFHRQFEAFLLPHRSKV